MKYFVWQVAKLWNLLPWEAAEAESINKIKWD